MDQACTLQEVQLAFDQVEYHFISLYKGNWGLLVKSQHTGATLAIHFKKVLESFELADGGLLWIMTDNAVPNYSMTRKLH
jgi:hypothetical protein